MTGGNIERILDGEVLLIDKPVNWTSFDVVNYIRNCYRHALGLKKVKIGHAGTLDPLASGLLILCTGRATKRIDEFMGLDKEYECTMDFSATTPSFDLETEADRQTPYAHLDTSILEAAIAKLTGTIMQVPPLFSAIKVDGVRAYEHARKEADVRLQAREVEVSAFELRSFEPPFATFSIRCSKGTYIRALARDLGIMVGCGAYLTALRRTAIGTFSVQHAMAPEAYCSKLRATL